MHQFVIHNEKNVLLINTCVFLVLKSTLSRRLGTGFIDVQTCCWFISLSICFEPFIYQLYKICKIIF